MTFHSNVGKKTLAKIWKEQNLDQDLILSSWIIVGPSKDLVFEVVSDYMQNFLQTKNKRIMLMNHKLMLRQLSWKNLEHYVDIRNPVRSKYQQIYEFQTVAGSHQAVLDELMTYRMRERERGEKKRIRRLILERKLDPPESFTCNVLNVLKIMDDRLLRLEKALRHYEEGRSDGYYGQSTEVKEKDATQEKQQQSKRGSEQSGPTDRNHKEKLTKVDRTADMVPWKILREPHVERIRPCECDTRFSFSPTTNLLPSVQREPNYVNDAFAGRRMSNSGCLYSGDSRRSSEISDTENSHFKLASGDIDWDLPAHFPQDLWEELADQKDSHSMFAKGDELIEVSTSKLEEAKNKISRINRVHFEKMFAAFGPLL